MGLYPRSLGETECLAAFKELVKDCPQHGGGDMKWLLGDKKGCLQFEIKQVRVPDPGAGVLPPVCQKDCGKSSGS